MTHVQFCCMLRRGLRLVRFATELVNGSEGSIVVLHQVRQQPLSKLAKRSTATCMYADKEYRDKVNADKRARSQKEVSTN